MDIFFCDLCSARVTTVDLRGGLGLRQDDDVICSQCVDLGKGKSWLAQRHTVVPVLSVAQSPTKNIETSPIDIARDRARTVDRDIPPARVKPQIIPPPAGPATSTEASVSVTPHQQRTSSRPSDSTNSLTPTQALHEDTDSHDEIVTKRAVPPPDYAGLAGAFSALNTNIPKQGAPRDTPSDDLMDFQEIPQDPDTTEVVPREGNSRSKTETVVDIKKRRVDVSTQQTETSSSTAVPTQATPTGRVSRLGQVSVPKTPIASKTSIGSAKKPGTGSHVKKTPTGSIKTSTGSVKTSTGSVKTPTGSGIKTPTGSARTSTGKTTGSLRSSKRTTYNKKATTALMVVSICIVMLAIILLVLASSMKSSHGHTSDKELPPLNLNEEIVSEISSARDVAQAALRKDVPVESELKKARGQIQALQSKILEFADRAKASQYHYTEEQVETALSNAGWQGTQSMIKNINDRLVRITNDKNMR